MKIDSTISMRVAKVLQKIKKQTVMPHLHNR